MTLISKRRVLLVGATGMLGTELTEALAARPELTLRVLLRTVPSDTATALAARGIEVVQGDALKPESLPAAMKDVQVVVSALPNLPDLFVPGHKNLILAAEQAKVERFVPSDFAVDFFKIRSEENFNLAMRKEVAPLFEGKKVRPIHVLNGAFLDTMLDPRAPFIDWQRNELPYFGDGQQPCDFTSVTNAAQYTAAACADVGVSEILRVAGDVKTLPQFAAAVSRAYGRQIVAVSRGSVEDLAQLIEQKQRTATNPWEWIALQYHHNMVSGRAKLEPLDNLRYGQIVPETVENFARRVGENNARGMSKSTA
jgi:nucleoside-diphosphate-sugar epimerase